jgi:ubiquinone/menaquinone biosynthesis C-methylase UbiE
MLNPRLYKSARVYDFFIKSLGYERSIDRFLRSLNLQLAGPIRVLDAGCGTGLLGLHFLTRYPEATLTATDLQANFLLTTLANARSRDIDENRIQVGVADISHPGRLTTLDQQQLTLQQGSFDIICVGAVVGYAESTEQSLRELIRLLAPGGTLINLEMSESPTGRFISRRYHYSNIALSRMQQILLEEGCSVCMKRLSLVHLPAKFTRVAIIAHKPAAT